MGGIRPPPLSNRYLISIGSYESSFIHTYIYIAFNDRYLFLINLLVNQMFTKYILLCYFDRSIEHILIRITEVCCTSINQEYMLHGDKPIVFIASLSTM